MVELMKRGTHELLGWIDHHFGTVSTYQVGGI